MKANNFYYWLDTSYYYGDFSIPKLALVRGKYDENGEKDRESEEVILWSAYEDIDGYNELAESGFDVYPLIDKFINEKLGFLPDYEVN